jgi:hypothetical protein
MWWLFPSLVLLLLAGLMVGGSARDRVPDVPDSTARSAGVIDPGKIPFSDEELDLMEAFDDLDRKRQGFVHCAEVRGLLGNPATESDVIRAVATSTPNFGVLFYEDFKRLAQRPGPLGTVLMERAARRWRLTEARDPQLAASGAPLVGPFRLTTTIKNLLGRF